ncbi:cysteine desulfurase [Micromonospora sp. NPDC049044]|uniref:aminotransferase class V-fold PLP-dependent enzyme n=1 Tax=unclassified Micromonospora TaxID=2617518 RepID=UPI0033F8CB50
MTTLPVEKIRQDFPTLADDEIYLDSVASSLTPIPVVEAMNDYYFRYRANVHRGNYDASLRASEQYEAALRTVAAFINASYEEIIFTTNTTMSLNMVALALQLNPGDEIVLSTLEHTSNMGPWYRLAQLNGVRLRWYNPGAEGVFDLDEFATLLNERTRVVALTWVSNVLGTVVPVHEVSRLCRERGILYVVDAAQAVPHLAVDVRAVDCDFLAFSGHKMLGPTGVGVLYMKKEHAERLMPPILGGGTVDTSAECTCETLESCVIDDSRFSPLPDKWQAGTPPIAEAIGLAAAMDYLGKIGFPAVEAHDRALVGRALAGLTSIKGVKVFGSHRVEDTSSILSFNIQGVPPEEVGRLLNGRYKVAVRAGSHCALSYFRGVSLSEGTKGNVRAGFYLYNTLDEVDRFVAAVDELATVLR